MILGDVASTVDIWPKLLEQTPMVGMLVYGMRWLATQLDKAKEAGDAVRKEKDEQLTKLYRDKEAQLDTLRSQLEEARRTAAEQSVRSAEAFRDLAFALHDLQETSADQTEQLRK